MCRYSGYQLITDFEFIIYSLKNLSFHLSNENCVWRPFQCLLISMVSSDGPSRSLLILVIFVLGSFSTLGCLEAYHFYRDFQRTDFQFHRFFFFFFICCFSTINFCSVFHCFFSSVCFGFDFVFSHKVNDWIFEVNVIWVAYSFRVRLSKIFFWNTPGIVLCSSETVI